MWYMNSPEYQIQTFDLKYTLPPLKGKEGLDDAAVHYPGRSFKSGLNELGTYRYLVHSRRRTTGSNQVNRKQPFSLIDSVSNETY